MPTFYQIVMNLHQHINMSLQSNALEIIHREPFSNRISLTAVEIMALMSDDFPYKPVVMITSPRLNLN